MRLAENELLIVFLAPPWGDVLTEGSGLDLRHARPPVPAIIDLVARSFSPQKALLAVQVHETVLPASIEEVSSRWQSSELMIYDIDDRARTMQSCLALWVGASDQRSAFSRGRTLR